MIIATLNGKKVHIPNRWDEITVKQAAEAYKIELPIVTDSFDFFKHINMVKKLVKILTDIKDPDQIDPSSLVHIFSKYLSKFVYDLHSVSPETYKPQLIDSFTHKGVTYLMPVHLELGENLVLQHGQRVKNFIEASNLLAQFAALKSDGFAAVPTFVACVVKEDRLEDFDEKVVVERGKLFIDLPMNVVWEVFFCTSQLIIKYGRDTLRSMSRKETAMEKLIGKLDMKLGRLQLRRAELVAQLKG